jgi:LytS/YehU family sensor histidine kinase
MYLQLETARLDHGFDYQISINKDIDAEFVQIPPLIIQPFVENAIWHGLVNKKGHGFLKIEISKLQSMLHIKISDNGIGREASAMLKKEQVKHKSYGIKITRQRIEMLNPKNELKISDLDDEMGNKGTLVELKIMGYD